MAEAHGEDRRCVGSRRGRSRLGRCRSRTGPSSPEGRRILEHGRVSHRQWIQHRGRLLIRAGGRRATVYCSSSCRRPSRGGSSTTPLSAATSVTVSRRAYCFELPTRKCHTAPSRTAPLFLSLAEATLRLKAPLSFFFFLCPPKVEPHPARFDSQTLRLADRRRPCLPFPCSHSHLPIALPLSLFVSTIAPHLASATDAEGLVVRCGGDFHRPALLPRVSNKSGLVDR